MAVLMRIPFFSFLAGRWTGEVSPIRRDDPRLMGEKREKREGEKMDNRVLLAERAIFLGWWGCDSREEVVIVMSFFFCGPGHFWTGQPTTKRPLTRSRTARFVMKPLVAPMGHSGCFRCEAVE